MSITAEKMAKTHELINQLLAKAEATPYPAEAQAFQEHAERLMVRYGIERAQLDAEAGRRGEQREKMTEAHYEVRGAYRVADARGLTRVARAFRNVVVLQSAYGNRTTLYLIGAESDVAQTVRLLDSISVQVKQAARVWWLRCGRGAHLVSASEKTRERRQFRLGFYQGAAERVEAVYGAAVAASDSGTDLVLADRLDRAQDYSEELYGVVKNVTSRPLAHGSYEASVAGVEAGRRADVQPERRVAAADRAALAE